MKNENVIIHEQRSCISCPNFGHYFPTDDWFDEEFVGYCQKTTRRKEDREMGYGRKDIDFPIPDWCPILLEQQSKKLQDVEKEEKIKEKLKLKNEGKEKFKEILKEFEKWPQEKRDAFLEELKNLK